MTDRTRGALLLLVTFVVGALAGAAVDRAYARMAFARENAPVEVDRIPLPLTDLGLSAAQEQQMRAVARRWRPQAGVALQEMRRKVSAMESDMMAEMLCFLTDAQRERYLATARSRGLDSTVLARRFALVRGSGCAAITDSTRR